jgi:beta-aspartyl-peptidase (threonine type)
VALLTRIRNPSHLARDLYLSPGLAPHAMLSGVAAEELGESLGEELVDPGYFFTESRWREHRRGLGLPEEPFPHCHKNPTEINLDQMPTGTVGAVALDIRGCIATVTSTGGKTNKLVGRIGDTPQLGAGSWAEQWSVRRWWGMCKNKVRAVGVSGTGDGDVSCHVHTCI